MGTDEMYRKTGTRHKAAVGVLFVVGVVINILLNPPTSTILFIGAMSVFTLFFTLMYGIRSRWQLTPAGRAMFWTFSSFSALALWIMTGLMFGQWALRNEIRDWLFMLFALATANLAISLWSVQHREIEKPEGETV